MCYGRSVKRAERDHLRALIDAETRRRNLPEIRRQVERGFERRNTRPRRDLKQVA